MGRSTIRTRVAALAALAGVPLAAIAPAAAQTMPVPPAAPATAGAPAPAAAAGDTLVLTLPSAIDLALERATPVLAGRDTLRYAGAAVLEAYGRFLPAVGAGASDAVESGRPLLSLTAAGPADATFRVTALQLSTRLNVFNAMRDRNDLRAATRTREAATLSLARARQLVAFDVVQRYRQVSLDGELVLVARAALDLSRARERQLEEQVRVGTRAPPDLLRQRAQTRFDEAALIQAENRRIVDQLALLSRLRLDPRQPVRITAPPADTVALGREWRDDTTLVRMALGGRPDLGSQSARRDAANYAIASAKAGYWPSLFIGADWFTSARALWSQQPAAVQLAPIGPVGTQLANQSAAVASVGFSWNLFDRFRTRLDVERATLGASREALAYEDLRLRVITDVRQAEADYEAAQQSLTAALAADAAAREAYDAVNGRFTVGLATFVDVLGAQSALEQAQAIKAQALAAFALQKDVVRLAAGQAPGAG